MKKEYTYVKLQVLSGMANPSPPVGPILGQRGVNIMQFCKLFNEKTSNMEKGIPIPVIIKIYSNRSFTFSIKSPPVSYLIKKKISINFGSKKPGHDIIGYIKRSFILDIAKIKYLDTNSCNLDSICKSIIGTAMSMGVKIKD